VGGRWENDITGDLKDKIYEIRTGYYSRGEVRGGYVCNSCKDRNQTSVSVIGGDILTY